MHDRIDETLRRRLLAALDRHPDPHLAARTVIEVASVAALRSVGIAKTAEFLRDAADLVERDALRGMVQ